MVSFNGYQIKDHDDLVGVFVTSLPIRSNPMVDGKPAPSWERATLTR